MIGVIENGAEVEADVYMCSVYGDVAKREVAEAGGSLTIMKELQYVGPARANTLEPPSSGTSKFAR